VGADGSKNTPGAIQIENIPPNIQDIPQQLEEIEQLNNKQTFQLVGWKLTEVSYKTKVKAYIDRLDEVQRDSFQTVDKMIKDSMDGFDLHILVLKDPTQASNDDDNQVKGLVIFNQESQSAKLPNGKTAIKVVIHHISAVQQINREVILE